ncbi:MAG: FAD-dependent oxidoreductase [Betaproteobacteria bacterium]|nr:FAD-dependent oxidoreductase [Betaproteobacteria bacterium]
MAGDQSDIVILGGGLAGLSAGYALTRAGRRVQVLEANSAVGGLARTVTHGEFRFDLGGHRFHTANRRIDEFVRGLLGEELLTVPRSSKIFLRGRYFDYPLQPLDACLDLGIATTFAILAGYAKARFAHRWRKTPLACLENWVIAHFGRPLFEIYFRDYSEKVWGIPCRRIAAEWIAQRVQGLSLGAAIWRACFKRGGSALPTLTDAFIYPRLGIGRIADKLRSGIEPADAVLTNARVTRIRHSGFRVQSVSVRHGERDREFRADEFISTIPLQQLVQLLHPPAPKEVLAAAAQLRHRDLVIVAVMLNRPRATDLTWIYFPEKHIPFGRVHEPANWSADLAPPGTTVLVAEHFCCRGDATWSTRDEDLISTTVAQLEQLGFIRREEVTDGIALRIPAAYPLFEVGYQDRCDTVLAYLDRFPNLHLAGRGGMFRYYNMDRAIESGFSAAETILQRASQSEPEERPMPARRRA